MRHELNLSPEFMEICVILHVHFGDYKKMYNWLTTENLNFGGVSPVQLIRSGRIKKVLDFVDANCDTKLLSHQDR